MNEYGGLGLELMICKFFLDWSLFNWIQYEQDI